MLGDTGDSFEGDFSRLVWLETKLWGFEVWVWRQGRSPWYRLENRGESGNDSSKVRQRIWTVEGNGWICQRGWGF